MISSARACISCARRSRSPCSAAATLPGSCCRPPASSRRSTRTGRAPPTSKRSRRPGSPTGSPAARTSSRSAGGAGRPRPAPAAAADRSPPAGDGDAAHRRSCRRPCRSSRPRCARSARRPCSHPRSRAGSRSPAAPRGTSGTRRAGGCSPRESCSVPVMPVPSRSCRCFSARSASSRSSAASCPRRSHCSTRSGRPPRRPASPRISTSRSGSRRCAGGSRSCSALVEDFTADAKARGEGFALAFAAQAGAVLYNGLGRYEEAFAAVREAVDVAPYSELSTPSAVAELVEAAARAGERRIAERALERLTLSTRPSGSDWALGVEARSRALLSDGDAAERLYQEAIERLRRTRVRVQLARTHLLYGEWLRRERRRARRPRPAAHRARAVHEHRRRGVRRARRA